MTGDHAARSFLRDLLLEHGYSVPKREPTPNCNELFDVALVTGGLASPSECDRLQDALGVPALVAPALSSGDSHCVRLEFPCLFIELEQQIASALGRQPPLRSDVDPSLGVSLERLLRALGGTGANLFAVLYEYGGAVVPDRELLERGFGATVCPESRDKGMRRLRRLLRWIALDAERTPKGLWRLVAHWR